MLATDKKLFGRIGIRVAAIAVSMALVMYPLIVYFGLRYFTTVSIALLVGGLCFVRLIVSRANRNARGFGVGVYAISVGGVVLAAASTITRSDEAMLFYPVVVNGILLAIFALSLVSPPTIIERIARIREPDLSAVGVAYTRNVTLAWTIFFLLNGAVALFTAMFTSMETWALYNGMIAYVLMGVMFAGEWLTRRFVMRSARE